MNLYELTLAAEIALSTYVSPDLDEWRTAIDPVLKALGESKVGNDKVSQIKFSRDVVSIETSYSVRCCQQTNDMNVPLAVLKADDPIRAATEYRIQKEIGEAMSRLAAAQRSVEEYTQQLVELHAESGSLSQPDNKGTNNNESKESTEEQVLSLQAKIDHLLAAMSQAAEEIRKCDYTPARSTLLVAISRAKSKQVKQGS